MRLGVVHTIRKTMQHASILEAFQQWSAQLQHQHQSCDPSMVSIFQEGAWKIFWIDAVQYIPFLAWKGVWLREEEHRLDCEQNGKCNGRIVTQLGQLRIIGFPADNSSENDGKKWWKWLHLLKMWNWEAMASKRLFVALENILVWTAAGVQNLEVEDGNTHLV